MSNVYNKNDILHHYISKLQVDVVLSDYSDLDYTWHSQNDFNYKNYIYLITEGACHIRLDGVDYFPHKGQMFLIPFGSNTKQQTINNLPFSKYWIIFNANIENVNLFDVLRAPSCIDVPNMDKTLSLFNEIKELNDDNNIVSALRTKSIFTELLATYFDDTLIQYPNYIFFKHDDFIKKITTYINNNYSKDISIEDMGNHMKFHPKYFSRIFNKKMAVTPMKFLKQVRVEHAKNLLVNSNESIQSIMYQCGFSNKSLFSRDFRIMMGHTPSQYRILTKKALIK